MRQKITTVKPDGLKDWLKLVIKPSLQNYSSIISGRDIPYIKLRPREALGAFILCAVGNYLEIDKRNIWTIASDAEGQDGTIICDSGPRVGEGFKLEQVYVPAMKNGDITDAIVDAINKKNSIGDQYAEQRHLVVLCDKSGDVDLLKLRSHIQNNQRFLSYWLMFRVDPPHWHYMVISLWATSDPPLVYKVTFSDDYENWEVNIVGKIKGTLSKMDLF